MPPSPSPQPGATVRPTQTPRVIAVPTDLPTSAPVLNPLTAPTLASPLLPAGDSPAPLPTNAFVIGQSAQGRDIIARRFGAGAKTLLLVGGIHTGYEANTVRLLVELAAHFESTPADVLPGMTLVLIPVANPDGLVLGRQTAGRFNANNVDLNRNWGCEWSAEAYWRTQQVDPGSSAFSEPETRALAQFIRDTLPAAAIFYHSAANGIFAGDCEDRGISDEFAAVLGEGTGYPYGQPFTAYRVTGTAASWVDGLGIPAVDLELTGTQETEFVRNLRGIMAVQAWLTGRAS